MRIFWTILFLTIPILGVGVFAMSWWAGSDWLPENISTTGQDIDHLFYLILAITGFFFVVTEFLLVHAIFYSRGKANGKADYYHGNHMMEMTWTGATVAILLFLAFYQMPAWAKAKITNPSPKTIPDVLVTGSQFEWQVRYPVWDAKTGKQREFDAHWTRGPNLNETFETSNELHVPVGEYVLVHVATRDVIHSFWLPNVRVKQDTLPGHIIPVWFDTTKEGNYEWVCTELCGWGHYRMRGKLVVQKKEDFDAWIKEKTAQMTKGGK